MVRCSLWRLGSTAGSQPSSPTRSPHMGCALVTVQIPTYVDVDQPVTVAPADAHVKGLEDDGDNSTAQRNTGKGARLIISKV